MWKFASKAIAGSIGRRNGSAKLSHCSPDCSDDEASSLCTGGEEGLDCPICLESFNVVENVPYVLWCGHTICKNCVLAFDWNVVTFPNLPVQLPLFISCPWCHLLSFRLVYKGHLKFPRKNYFLLWLVESKNGERARSYSTLFADRQPSVQPSSSSSPDLGSESHHRRLRRVPQYTRTDRSFPDTNHFSTTTNNWNSERIRSSLLNFLSFLIQLTAKFPLVIMLLLIVLYAVPASAAILALYMLVTLLFGLPAFFMLYFAYPSLDWLVKEITTWWIFTETCWFCYTRILMQLSIMVIIMVGLYRHFSRQELGKWNVC